MDRELACGRRTVSCASHDWESYRRERERDKDKKRETERERKIQTDPPPQLKRPLLKVRQHFKHPNIHTCSKTLMKSQRTQSWGEG